MIRFAMAALAAVLMTAPAFAAEAPKAPVSLKAPEGAKQPAVKFNHQSEAHKKQECAKCHTDAANAKAVPAVEKVTAGDMKPTNPAHQLCLNCHKENKGPAGCATCHKK